jgi:hypothetical protein
MRNLVSGLLGVFLARSAKP